MLIRFKPNKTLLPFDSIIFILSVIQITLFFVSSIIPNSTILYIAVFALNVILMVYQSPVVRLHFHPVIILFSLFVLFCFLSSKWAISPSQAKRMSMSLLKMLAVSVVYYWYFRKYDNIEPFLKVLLWSIFMILVVTVIYFGPSIIFNLVLSNTRLSSEFLNTNELGRLCSQALIILFFFIKKRGILTYIDDVSNFISLIFGLLCFLVIIVSQSRTAIFSLATGITVYYFLFEIFKSNSSLDRIKTIITVLFFICCLFIILQLPAFDGVRNRMYGLLSGIKGKKSDDSTNVRIKMIDFGINTFKKNFFVGVGIDNAKEINPYMYAYLHNNYVELLADTGIIGFSLYYSMFIFIIIKIFIRPFRDAYDAVVIALISCILVTDLGGVTYYLRELPFILMVFCVNDNIKERRNDNDFI